MTEVHPRPHIAAYDQLGALQITIDRIVCAAIEQHLFPGAVVLVARDRQILHCGTYGATTYALAPYRHVTLDTIYDVASLTKMFTATTTLRLVELGALDLDAPVRTYLPEMQTDQVTIHHLLTHTSGLDLRLSTLRHAGRAGLLNAAYACAPTRTPGTTVAYTNINALLLGEAIARVCGARLDEVIEQLILSPLDIHSTRFNPPPALYDRIAPTEIDQEWRGGLVHGTVHDESAHALGGIAGHAGLFSTANDLLTFCHAWLPPVDGAAPLLLSREMITQATTNHTVGKPLGCGLGWMIDRPNFMGDAPTGTYGHTGFTGPALVILPESRCILVFLNNRVHPHRAAPAHHAVTAALVNHIIHMLSIPTNAPHSK